MVLGGGGVIRRRRRVHASPAGYDAERDAKGKAGAWLRSCAGKDRYTSEAAARAAIGLQLGTAALDTYRCDHCPGWHLTQRTQAGARKAPPPVHVLAFVCAGCRARHASIAVSPEPWRPARMRVALLKLEPEVIRDGWSIGAGDDSDHCPTCAAALGLETTRTIP